MALPVLLAEADRAADMGFLALAESLLRTALSVGEPAECRARLAVIAAQIGRLEECAQLLSGTPPSSLAGQLRCQLARATLAERSGRVMEPPQTGMPPSLPEDRRLWVLLQRRLARAERSDPRRATEPLSRALELLEVWPEAALHAQVLLDLAAARLRQGMAQEAEMLARQAGEKAKECAHPRLRVEALETLGDAQWALGGAARAAATFGHALETARETLWDLRDRELEEKRRQAGDSAPSPLAAPAITPAPAPAPTAVATEVPLEPPLTAAPPKLPAAALPPEKAPSRKLRLLIVSLISLGLIALAVASGMRAYRQWSQQPGRLFLVTSPEEVRLSVNGEAFRAVLSQSTIELAPGAYELEFSADDHESQTLPVTLTRDQDLPLDVSLRPSHGYVRFSSWTPEATLTLIDSQGQTVETTSEITQGTPQRLPIGKFTMRIEKRLYEPKEKLVEILAQDTLRKPQPLSGMKLVARDAELKVQGEPKDASVMIRSLNDEDSSRTPEPDGTVVLDPKGRWELVVEKPGYQPFRQRLRSLRAGITTEVSYRLDPDAAP
jgi:hypothetical protein